jgi:hypothetical protein
VFPLSTWLLAISIIFGIFIIIDTILYAYPKPIIYAETLSETHRMPSLVDIKEGKEIYDYKFPKNVVGGLFSKTFIPIDDKTVLRLRHQLISEDMMRNKEKTDE